MADSTGIEATSAPLYEDTTAPSQELTKTDGTVQKKKTKIIKRKRRPARPQQDPSTFKTEPPPQTGTIFNIWYNKWSGGDREDAISSKHQAKGRCNVALDSGYTRADKVPGSYFCLFFARGLCPKGQDCDYLHRLPNSRIGKEGGLGDIFASNVDCFGRDKFSDYRDDMGGVGSFMRQNRTLYVGRIHVTDDIEEVVARHFQEWGQVERTRVLPSRGVAFVTYVHLANSEFAKEAMAHQSLDHNETLNVRWATVDPNPVAQKREAAKIEEQAAEAIRRALPASYVAELEGRRYEGADPEEERKRRKIEGSFGLKGYDAPDHVWYAAEKARIEGGEQPKMLENGQAEEDDEDGPLLIGNGNASAQQAAANNGLLGASTLAALQGFKASSNGEKKAPDKPAGPLVAYGSDSEDDD
ncbi:Pre-mRNA-splicing factor cwc2 [Fulvia fulva]|uniref:Pre-mRNA-splicing factor CWC2 n=1 Tax=Passalora fulva TaxID=5499 RepID=A0A9Q8PB46_PASFU|nr:Pre-mRNA-splicing factor cwc2 [Fulvia fulva]KAK4621339.1 Pre-mRNA-splicing factor cwc2 [Fulvia fulva]KAK4622723.1 Pre-mRNA-splicing factor cwc2 [Fulvia fulva]UJO19222.1 Pre-mRNA-splicing factor cwc2 [Fulvia fulva]WPV15808.1 Pre-mRNA-splicing factor cwc2 [Fulvia fulva]WPV31135.1 Pre-mRNA-splicing factor cwc2 [Fulvia fulva]